MLAPWISAAYPPRQLAAYCSRVGTNCFTLPTPVPATGSVVSGMRHSNTTYSTWNTKDLDSFIQGQTTLTIIAHHTPQWIEQIIYYPTDSRKQCFFIVETKRVKEQRQNGKREIPYSVLLFTSLFLSHSQHSPSHSGSRCIQPHFTNSHFFILCNQQPLTNKKKKKKKMPANLHVLIVGAGVSGLMAGALLERAGISYEVQ